MEVELSLVGERPTPEILDKFSAVGLVRGEFVQRRMLESILRSPVRQALHEYLSWLAQATGPRPVWYRTADLLSDEGNCLNASVQLEAEHNPLLGRRGARRSLAIPDEFKAEFAVLAEVCQKHPNLRVQIPFVSSAEEFAALNQIATEEGVPGPFGTMVETPAAALAVEELVDAGAVRLLIGLNDLSCLTFGAERRAGFEAKMHPILWRLIATVQEQAIRRGCKIGIAGSLSHEVIDRARQADLDFVTVHYPRQGALWRSAAIHGPRNRSNARSRRAPARPYERWTGPPSHRCRGGTQPV